MNSNPRAFPLWRILTGVLVGIPAACIGGLLGQFNGATAQGANMNNETFVYILLFIGAIVAAVLYVLDRTNRRLADALPPQLLPVFTVALNALAELAKQTETPLDDEIIQRLIDALKTPGAQNKLLQRVPKVPADTPIEIPEAG